VDALGGDAGLDNAGTVSRGGGADGGCGQATVPTRVAGSHASVIQQQAGDRVARGHLEQRRGIMGDDQIGGILREERAPAAHMTGHPGCVGSEYKIPMAGQQWILEYPSGGVIGGRPGGVERSPGGRVGVFDRQIVVGAEDLPLVGDEMPDPA
jgi:hypothetical protein